MMEAPIYTLESSVNKRNRARCELYRDRVVIRTECDGGLMPIYENRSREIPLPEIRRVVISKGGVKLITHHPNCIHFVTKADSRTVDEMYRDRTFHANDYLDEGVFQLAPKSESELDEKLEIARKIKEYIEQANA